MVKRASRVAWGRAGSPVCVYLPRVCTSMISVRLALCRHVVEDHIDGESRQPDTEAWEGLAEHCAAGEHGVSAPGLALGPGVAEELGVFWGGHLDVHEVRGKRAGCAGVTNGVLIGQAGGGDAEESGQRSLLPRRHATIGALHGTRNV